MFNFEKIKKIEEPIEEKRPFWGEFKGAEIDEVGEYKEPTPEQKEEIDSRLARLSEIFGDADFDWYIDGALNISLHEGEYIRDHKDLDLSVFDGDLEGLQTLLKENGFAVFHRYERDGKKYMKRVPSKDIRAKDLSSLSIAKIKLGGRLDRETDDPFNYVDLHVHDRDENGDVEIGYSKTKIPGEYFAPIEKELEGGGTVRLSHPLVTTYHKLHEGREYDYKDIEKMREQLSDKDLEVLEDTMASEIMESEREIREHIAKLWEFALPTLKLFPDEFTLQEKMMEYPPLKERKDNKRVSEFIRKLSYYTVSTPGVGFEEFNHYALEYLEPGKKEKKNLQFLDNLQKEKKELAA